MEDFTKERINEFKREGKNFFYFNIAGLTSVGEFETLISEAKKRIIVYQPKSVYVITSSMDFFDTRIKEVCAEWIVFNKPYVIASALVDISGLTRIMAKSIYKMAERDVAVPFATMEEAIRWLLEQK